MFKWLRFKRFMKQKKSFDANVQTFCLTKSDRINRRIEAITNSYIRETRTVTKKDVKSLSKAIQIMIAQELTYKGIEKK